MNIALLPFATDPFSSWFRSHPLPPGVPQRLLVPPPQGPLSIDKGATLVVERPIGARVTCVRGSLWVTHDGCPQDIMVEEGATYVSDSPRRMMVHGLEASAAMVG